MLHARAKHVQRTGTRVLEHSQRRARAGRRTLYDAQPPYVPPAEVPPVFDLRWDPARSPRPTPLDEARHNR